MPFPPDVEKWRSLVAKHFPPGEVERALWVIWHESGGNAGIASRFNAGGGENSHGLWQINLNAHPHMEGKATDPEAATAYAAQLWKDQGWRPWSVTHKGFPTDLSASAAASVSGSGSATSSVLSPLPGNKNSMMGPNGRTYGQITGTQYLTPEEGEWWRGVRDNKITTATPAPATTAAGGGTMKTRDDLAREMFGKSYAELSRRDQFNVDEAFNNMPAPKGGLSESQLLQSGAVARAPGLYEVNGVQYRIQPDGTYAVSTVAGEGAAASPRGGLTVNELVQAGAQQRAPGIYELNGARYQIQPDGSYSVASVASTPANTVLSGAGLAGIFQNQAKAGGGATTELIAPGAPAGPSLTPVGSQPMRANLSQMPQNNLLTEQQIANATGKPGIEQGDILGVAEPGYTGLPKMPITYGGIYGGGGLTPIAGMAQQAPNFTGFIPPSTQDPTGRSIGVGFDPNLINQAAGIPGGSPDTALNIMSLRQQAVNSGLEFPDLNSIQGLESTGRLPKGSYKAALAKLSAGVGQPLDALQMFTIPDPQLYNQAPPPGWTAPEEVQFQATGGTNYAGIRPEGPPSSARDEAGAPKERIPRQYEYGPIRWQTGGVLGEKPVQNPSDPRAGMIATANPRLVAENPMLYYYQPVPMKSYLNTPWNPTRPGAGMAGIEPRTPTSYLPPAVTTPVEGGSGFDPRMLLDRMMPQGFANGTPAGGVMTQGEMGLFEIDPQGNPMRLKAVIGEGPDGIGGQTAPERLDVTPMGQAPPMGAGQSRFAQFKPNIDALMGLMNVLGQGSPAKMRPPYVGA